MNLPVYAPSASQTHHKGFRFFAGYFAGICNIAVGYPLDTLAARITVHGGGERFSGGLQCLNETIRREGFFGLYKGSLAQFITKGLFSATVFQSKHLFADLISKDHSQLTLFQQLLTGVAAGCVGTTITAPVDLIKTKLQLQYHKKGQIGKYTGPAHVVKSLFQDQSVGSGIRSLYKVWPGQLLQQGFGAGIFFWGHSLIMKVSQSTFHWDKQDYHQRFLSSFIGGGVAGMAYWTAIFPIFAIKSRIAFDPLTNPTMVKTAKNMFHNHGMRVFYQGLSPALIRAIPTNAVTFLMFDLAYNFLEETFHGHLSQVF